MKSLLPHRHSKVVSGKATISYTRKPQTKVSGRGIAVAKLTVAEPVEEPKCPQSDLASEKAWQITLYLLSISHIPYSKSLLKGIALLLDFEHVIHHVYNRLPFIKVLQLKERNTMRETLPFDSQ